MGDVVLLVVRESKAIDESLYHNLFHRCPLSLSLGTPVAAMTFGDAGTQIDLSFLIWLAGNLVIWLFGFLNQISVFAHILTSRSGYLVSQYTSQLVFWLKSAKISSPTAS